MKPGGLDNIRVVDTTRFADYYKLSQAGMAMFSCLQGNDFTKSIVRLSGRTHIQVGIA
jgi:hypothetical protein